jgi:hypothetical protein
MPLRSSSRCGDIQKSIRHERRSPSKQTLVHLQRKLTLSA